MHSLAQFGTLTASELRNVRRDSMLRWMAAFPIVMALLLRWLVPLIDSNLELDLRPYYLLIMSTYAVLAAPVTMGFIVGILLLDERDNETLRALRVTPLSMRRYLAWKLTLPLGAVVVLTLLSIPLAGLIPFRIDYTGSAVVGALWAPILALAMVAFAKNKLQGFLLMRITNLLIFVPMAAWFFEAARWEPLFAVLPAYWPLKASWLAARGESYGVYLAVGAVYHGAVIAWLYRHFQRVQGREG